MNGASYIRQKMVCYLAIQRHTTHILPYKDTTHKKTEQRQRNEKILNNVDTFLNDARLHYTTEQNGVIYVTCIIYVTCVIYAQYTCVIYAQRQIETKRYYKCRHICLDDEVSYMTKMTYQ